MTYTKRTKPSIGTYNKRTIPSEALSVIDSYSEVNQNDSDNMVEGGAAEWDGQSFTTPNNGIDFILDSCKFYLKKAVAGTGTAVAYLYAHSGTYGTSSVPTGTPLATSDNFDVSSLSSSVFGLATFNFSGANRITLNANTHYCIVVRYTGADSMRLGVDTTSSAHDGNHFQGSGTPTWTPAATEDVCFYISGIPKKFIYGKRTKPAIGTYTKRTKPSL